MYGGARSPLASPSLPAQVFPGLAMLLFLALGILLAPAPLMAAEATVFVPFGAGVSRDDAETIAGTAARIEALRLATHSLSGDSAALFAAETPENLLALAAATFETHKLTTRIVGYPPEVGLTIHVGTAPRGGDAEKALRDALRRPEALQLREQTLTQVRNTLYEARDLATRAARHRQQAGMDSESPFDRRIGALARTLRSLERVESVLVQLDGVWATPQEVVSVMRLAVSETPETKLAWCIMGEALLQLDRPQDAIDALDRALALDGGLTRARLARGVANLRLQLTTLAVDDLTVVIREAPDMVAAWRARGAAHMVREEFDAMCADFNRACGLGDCEGLVLARNAGRCLPTGSPGVPSRAPAEAAGNVDDAPDAAESHDTARSAAPPPDVTAP